MPERVAGPRRDLAAALVVLSETLSATELQSMIGLAPDDSWQSGDPIGRSGRARQRFSGWSIREGSGEEPVEAYVLAILDRVSPARENVATAAGDPRVHSVALWVWSEGRTFALDLPPTRVGDIAALGASLKIDVYDVDDDGYDVRGSVDDHPHYR